MSVQWIACPECAFKLPYAILGKKGSFRTGSEFASLCRNLADPASTSGLECPILRAEAERVLKIRLSPVVPGAPEARATSEDSDD